MAFKHNDPCLKKAFDDEKLFILMTRDATAPSVIVEWIKHNIGIQPREKLMEALDTAIEMYERNTEMIERKNLKNKADKISAAQIEIAEVCLCEGSYGFDQNGKCGKCHKETF